MPIEVRHDPDYLAAYQQLGMRRRQQQAAVQNPETDANPFTMSKARGSQVAAQLAQDRERLGQKQKEKYGADTFRDTEAGFDWQNPVQIEQSGPDGGKQYLTMYESLGVDPLRTGGFGALGTRETRIQDYGNTIDPTDPRDRATLGKIVQSRQSMALPEDVFLSPEELRDKEDNRKFQQGMNRLAARESIRGQFDQERDDRNFSNSLARDRQRSELKRQAEEEDLARNSKQYQREAELSIPDEKSRSFLEPWRKARIEELQRKYVDALANGNNSPAEMARASQMMTKAMNALMSVPPGPRPQDMYGPQQIDPLTGRPFQTSGTGKISYGPAPQQTDEQAAGRARAVAEAQQAVREAAAQNRPLSTMEYARLQKMATDMATKFEGVAPDPKDVEAAMNQLTGGVPPRTTSRAAPPVGQVRDGDISSAISRAQELKAQGMTPEQIKLKLHEEFGN